MITRSIKSNLNQISCLLIKSEDFNLANDVVGVLDLLSFHENDCHALNIELMLKLTKAMSRYFFLCIKQDGELV